MRRAASRIIDPEGFPVARQLQRVITIVAASVALVGVAAGTTHPTATPSQPTPAAAAAELAAAAATAEGIGCSSTRACTPAHGGALMTTTRNSCTAGLPVRSRGNLWYLLTAGHCVANAKGATWRQSGIVLGKGVRWEYGGLGTEGRAGSSDIGVLRITGSAKVWNPRSRVLVLNGKARTQKIVAAKDAKLGAKVCVTAGRSGTTRCGTVVSATTSLKYASPGLAARTVQNLALVKGICVQPGDSGSPVFAGSAAVGIAVARSASGCYMWYAKVPAQLRHFALRVAA